MAKAKKEESNVVVVDTNAMKKEVMDYVDLEMDKRIEKSVTEKVKKEFLEEIDKANRRLIREKNRKILIKNIFLLLFFALILFLTYLLYTEHYFDQFFHPVESKEEVVEKTEKKEEVEEVHEPTLEELKGEYASYLNDYVLSDQSAYLEDFYQGNLTDEIKNYFSLNSMNFEKLEVEDDYHVIDQSSLGDACSHLFGIGCKEVSFDYNGNKVRYFEKLESYVTNRLLEKGNTSISREIIDIKVEGKKVVITTVEGIIYDGYIYSVYPYESVGEYFEDGIINYPINKVIYTFEDQKLVQIEKG